MCKVRFAEGDVPVNGASPFAALTVLQINQTHEMATTTELDPR